jgi:hypothetical protein
MATLRVGRVVLPIVNDIVSQRIPGGLKVTGWADPGVTGADASLTARTWRSDLIGHFEQRDIIPVVSDGVAVVSGFYRLTDEPEMETINPSWIYTFELELEYLGSSQDLKFESRNSGTVLTNDFSITAAASEPVHAPPANHFAYDVATMPTFMTRSTSDGATLRVYRDVSFTADPKWSVTPDNWYVGGCRVERVP